MIWGGGPDREFVLSFFFPRQLADELLFLAQVAVEFFFPLLPGPPQIINGSSLKQNAIGLLGRITS